MKKLLFATTAESNTLSELTMTLLRVYVGLGMAFSHGITKMPPQEPFVDIVTAMGFPAPLLFAWMAGISEFAGGILIAAGLLTRPAAFMIAGTMFVAGFVTHAADPFNVKELAFFYLAAALVFAVRGAGQWSLDRLITRGSNS